jgi:hypothetical protein
MSPTSRSRRTGLRCRKKTETMYSHDGLELAHYDMSKSKSGNPIKPRGDASQVTNTRILTEIPPPRMSTSDTDAVRPAVRQAQAASLGIIGASSDGPPRPLAAPTSYNQRTPSRLCTTSHSRPARPFHRHLGLLTPTHIAHNQYNPEIMCRLRMPCMVYYLPPTSAEIDSTMASKTPETALMRRVPSFRKCSCPSLTAARDTVSGLESVHHAKMGYMRRLLREGERACVREEKSLVMIQARKKAVKRLTPVPSSPGVSWYATAEV